MEPVYTPESETGKELRRWNLPKSQGGHRPDRFEEYPKMLFRAAKRPDGIVSTGEGDDRFWVDGNGVPRPGAAESFSQGLRMIVRSEDEERRALENGWCPSLKDAKEAYEARERAIGRAAAERIHADRNMSEKAQQEAAAADAATPEHVPEIKPKRKYTRRAKPEA